MKKSSKRLVGLRTASQQRHSERVRNLAFEWLEPRRLLAAPQLAALDPLANTHTAPVDTEVAATFDQAIASASVTDQTFAVHAMQTGRLFDPPNAVSTSGATLTMAPAGNFHPGELVQATATTGIENPGAETLAAPYVWQFRTAVTGGSGYFRDNGQTGPGTGGNDVALGDLDGDGYQDAFVAKPYTGCEVYFNTGQGGFRDSGQRVGSSTSYSVALGDLDGDGDLDAFVGNDGANLVWLNDGRGTFSDSGQNLGYLPTYAVALGDLDGDGDLDAVAADGGEDKVWLNDGVGVFSDSGGSLGNTTEYCVVLGDLDEDGDLDAIVGLTAWLNDGSGAFSDSGQYLATSPSWAFGIGLGDIDGDGDLDVYVPIFGGNEVWYNDGSAVFSNSGQSLGDAYSLAAVLRDIDADGDLDAFVVSDRIGKVWLNDGQGVFSDSGTDFGVAAIIRDAVMADLDGDGDFDAFVVGNPNVVGLNDGQGHFTDYSLGSSSTVALGDLDGDGDLDAFRGNDGANEVWLNDGFGTFTDGGQSLGSSETRAVALGDLNGDGHLDAFVGNSNQPNKVWLNDGLGAFIDSGQSLSGSSTYAVALGDLNGDGHLDAFVGNRSQPNKVWLNDGQGNFADSGQDLGSSLTTCVALGDLDDDGDLDAFVAVTGSYSGNPNEVWFNDGAGNFTDSGQALGGSFTYGVSLGDLDGDGDLDAFAANSGYSAYPAPNKVWLNDGSGTFFDSGQDLGISTSRSVALGDLEGDGDLDVFVAGSGQYSGDPIEVWLNDGAGSFSGSGQRMANTDSLAVALGDLDGDGDLDAFVEQSLSGHVLLNQGAIRGTKWHDLDADGTPDADEPGLEGWTIFLDESGNGLLDPGEPSTTTDASGAYVFPGLSVGTYTVAELPRAGWMQTAPLAGYHTVIFTSERLQDGIDFGNLDVGPPDVTLSAPSFTNDPTPSVTVTATDNDPSGLPDGRSVVLDVDLTGDGDFLDTGEQGYVSTTLVGGTVTFDVSPALIEAAHGLRARVADQIGNEGTSETGVVVVDMTPPEVVLTAPAFTTDRTPNVTVTATDANGLPDGTVVSLDVDMNNDGDFLDSHEQDNTSATLIAGSATFDVKYTLAVGTSNLRARVTDLAGNEGVSTTVAVEVDPAPTVILTAPKATDDPTPSVTVTATDNQALPDGTLVGLDVDLNNDGDFLDTGEREYTTASLLAGSAAFDVTPALAVGTYGFRAHVADQAGSEGQSAIRVVVIYGQTPTLTLEIAAESVSEAVGPEATTARITRYADPSSALVVAISTEQNGNPDDTELYLPASITIPAGEPFVEFEVDTVNDGDLDGDQANLIVVASATGFDDASDTIAVTDDDTVGHRTLGGHLYGTIAAATYQVTFDIEVDQERSLTVAPGTTLRFEAYTQLNVLGNLMAEGEPGSEIVFTSASASPASGDWRGIHLEPYIVRTVLDHVEIAYATWGVRLLATIYPKVTVSNADIHDNGFGVAAYTGPFEHIWGNNVLILDNAIHDNETGVYLSAWTTSGQGDSLNAPTIFGNAIYDNRGSGIAMSADYTRIFMQTVQYSYVSPEVTHNFIHDNGDAGVMGTAIRPADTFGYGEIGGRYANNLVVDNVTDGIQFLRSGSASLRPDIINNTIAGNGRAGIYHSALTAGSIIQNNTVVDNRVGIKAIVSPVLDQVGYNNVWGNASGDWIYFPASYGDPTTTNANGTPADAQMNISEDPQFMTSLTGTDYYHIQWTSPCVNAGTDSAAPADDYDSQPRVSTVDIGFDEVITVTARHVFYNNSKWDGHLGFDKGDPAANEFDDGAIATDKTALLPGQTGTFANYTSYPRGINGIMVGIQGLADPVAVADGDLSEFDFKYGNDDTPDDWLPAPAPLEVTVRDIGGGVHRVTFVWADKAIPNKNWVQVTVKQHANTGLTADDVFYFGNTVGENTGDFRVDYSDAFDIIWPLLGTPLPIGPDHVADINRDGRIDYSDVFDDLWPNLSGPAPLKPITPPVPPPVLLESTDSVFHEDLSWAIEWIWFDALQGTSADSEEDAPLEASTVDGVFSVYYEE